MRYVITIVAAMLIAMSASPAPAAAAAAASAGAEPTSLEAIQRWISDYHAKPDPAGVPAVVRVLARMSAFKDVESSGTQVGFVAGVLGANPARAEGLVLKMLPL